MALVQRPVRGLLKVAVAAAAVALGGYLSVHGLPEASPALHLVQRQSPAPFNSLDHISAQVPGECFHCMQLHAQIEYMGALMGTYTRQLQASTAAVLVAYLYLRG